MKNNNRLLKILKIGGVIIFIALITSVIVILNNKLLDSKFRGILEGATVLEVGVLEDLSNSYLEESTKNQNEFDREYSTSFLETASKLREICENIEDEMASANVKKGASCLLVIDDSIVGPVSVKNDKSSLATFYDSAILNIFSEENNIRDILYEETELIGIRSYLILVNKDPKIVLRIHWRRFWAL